MLSQYNRVFYTFVDSFGCSLVVCFFVGNFFTECDTDDPGAHFAASAVAAAAVCSGSSCVEMIEVVDVVE